MRRTVLSAAAFACAAVLASTVPAFAAGTSASPSPAREATTAPSARPSKVPSAEPTRAATPVPSAVPRERRGQVDVVPSGAPNTGVAPESNDSGSNGMLIGTGAAGAFAVGGAALLVVRRRRATGA
ncbi:sortase-dependent protein [Streptomyces sp. NPDC020298]|uniref:sortase-dependent protein n=1 Tax=unclassified Streptomyces TaxID=2593676 RepID=UPI0033E4AA1B